MVGPGQESLAGNSVSLGSGRAWEVKKPKSLGHLAARIVVQSTRNHRAQVNCLASGAGTGSWLGQVQ
jgi:hypothetical protein